MKNEIILSIIIPCYNSEKYIGGLLKKLCAEELTNCEIVVVNDGSSDRTKEIISQYANEAIKIINQNNCGVSVARNNGIESASGKYILFLDSDDSFYPESISRIKEKIKVNENNQEAEVIAFGYESRVNGKIERNYSWDKYDGIILSHNQVNKLYLTKQICFHICSIVVKKEFIEKQGLRFTVGLPIGEDIEFILKMLGCVNRLQYYASKFFIYQIRNDSAMKGYINYSWTQYESFLVNVQTINGLLQSGRNKPLKQYYSFFLANSYLSNLFYYLKSETKHKDINDGFKKYNYLLREKYPIGNWKRYIVLRGMGLLPIKIFLANK